MYIYIYIYIHAGLQHRIVVQFLSERRNLSITKINVVVFWDMTPCSLIELPCIWGVPGSSIGQKVCTAVFTVDAGLLARSQ